MPKYKYISIWLGVSYGLRGSSWAGYRCGDGSSGGEAVVGHTTWLCGVSIRHFCVSVSALLLYRMLNFSVWRSSMS